MTVRVFMVLATTLLALPAWSDEPAPAASARSFDLTNDAIRKIVHDTASAQSVIVQVTAVSPAPRDSAPTVRFVPAEKPSAPIQVARRLPPAAKSASSPGGQIFSSLFGAVVDNVVHSSLGIDPAVSTDEQYEVWRACRARDEKCLLPPAPPFD